MAGASGKSACYTSNDGQVMSENEIQTIMLSRVGLPVE